MIDPGALDAVMDRALRAYGTLSELGEEIDDEWTYVTELSAAWRDRLEAVVVARSGERLDPVVADAVEAAIDAAALIEDPHRAIDWLSTFPQVVLVALGEPT